MSRNQLDYVREEMTPDEILTYIVTRGHEPPHHIQSPSFALMENNVLGD